ncbi:MAG: hypothetical protein JWR14_1307 [Caballeronia sp.]|jgi:hypothetical protein|nr:hypothetical protein [Caballeronia sp.]
MQGCRFSEQLSWKFIRMTNKLGASIYCDPVLGVCAVPPL